MIPTFDQINERLNRTRHVLHNADDFIKDTAERLANELIIQKIKDEMKRQDFSQKIWMNTKILKVDVTKSQIIIKIQNYYFSESGFDVAIAREHGTKDHFIKPRIKQALSWIQNGVRLFSRGHMVSGIKSLFIIKKTIAKETPNLQTALNREFNSWQTSILNPEG